MIHGQATGKPSLNMTIFIQDPFLRKVTPCRRVPDQESAAYAQDGRLVLQESLTAEMLVRECETLYLFLPTWCDDNDWP